MATMVVVVVVGEQYCAPFQVELTVTKKVMSLSGGSFEVTGGEGQLLFKMDGHFFSVHDKRVLLDASGCPLLTAHNIVIIRMAAIAVVGEQYCAPFRVELTVTKKVTIRIKLSFEVTDGEGQLLFQTQGNALSLRDKYVLLDASGCAVLTVHKKLLCMHDTWKVSLGETFNGQSTLFIVKRASLVQHRSNLKVFLVGNSNEDCPDFTVKGSFFELETKIYQGDIEIAKVNSRSSPSKAIFGIHPFCAVVSPGIDQAFIVTLFVIMDAIYWGI